nr:esterase B1-like [Aedes albopictus]
MCNAERVSIQLAAGKVLGCKAYLPNGSSYNYFKGIPYAKPPVGNLRFKPPEPLSQFDSEVLDCSYERNACFSCTQFPPLVAVGEDCLYANVFTPGCGGSLPVMVCIHGGGFASGTGDASIYGPRHLLQHGVVVVTFNYRIGPFGFLCLPEKGVHGNMGLKDQRLLLKWVHENIAKFGGDPSNVTLFGISAGGASVHLHYLTESSRKYFHRAICQSGVAFNVWVEQHDAESKAIQLAKCLGCSDEGVDRVYETLMNASAFDINASSEDCVSSQDMRVFRIFGFTPVVESTSSVEPFLTESYIDLLCKPDMTNIPIMMGVTSNEGISFLLFQLIVPCIDDPKWFVPPQLQIQEHQMTAAGEEVRRFYMGDSDASQESTQSLADFISDCTFVIPAIVASELHARYQHKAPQFFYRFSFEGRLNVLKLILPNVPDFSGACHGAELPFLHDSTYFEAPNFLENSPELKIREAICQLWTSFARTGIPASERNELVIAWDSVERIDCRKENFQLDALDLGNEIRMISKPFADRIAFWKKLFKKYNCDYLNHRALR